MERFVQRLIRVVTALIPARRLRREVRRRWANRARAAWIARMVPELRERYAKHERTCRDKLAKGEPLRVCFLVCDAAMFSAEPVFTAMLADPRFKPVIAVAPRVSRGEEFLRATLDKTLNVLRGRYGERVESLYDPDTKVHTPLVGRADVVFTSIIYQDQTFHEYLAEKLSETSLVACITYGYSGLFNANVARTIFLPQIAFVWRYFVSNPQTLALWTEKNPLLQASARLSGYAKMDRLASVSVHAERPKTVIIAPHHSLPQSGVDDGLTLSTFLTHAEFFLQLPKEYPQVKFVFRPHPLLFPRLATAAWWGAEKTAAYRAAMEAMPNVEFQQGGDYFETFANSDALIHDCGSFLAEYFYTGRPQCYLLASRETEEREFLPFGRKLVDLTYKAFDAAAVREFMDEVVQKGNDAKRQARDEFAASDVCCFYPHATDRVVAEVIGAIEGETQR